METKERTQVLGTQAYVTEDEMLRLASGLNRYLHQLERQVQELADEVHVVVCERGLMPIEEKTIRTLDSIRTLGTDPGLGAALETARRVAELKAQINTCEAAVGLMLKERAARSPAPSALAPVA